MPLERSFVWCWHLDTQESRSEVHGKFCRVALEKDGEDQKVDQKYMESFVVWHWRRLGKIRK